MKRQIFQSARLFDSVERVFSERHRCQHWLGMRQRLLEGPLHDRCLNDAFADFLRNFTRPLLAYYSPRASQDSMRPASSLRRNDRRFNQIEFIRTDLLEQKFAGEFAFEHAIEAYEQLIDSTFAEEKR